MKVLRSFGDRDPIELKFAFNYSVNPKSMAPEIYKTQESLKKLELELNYIIKKTPIKILPFSRANTLSISNAEARRFSGIEKGMPIDISLYPNHSIEMFEFDTDFKGKLEYFRVLPHYSDISFEVGENDVGFNEKDLVSVRVGRFYPHEL